MEVVGNIGKPTFEDDASLTGRESNEAELKVGFGILCSKGATERSIFDCISDYEMYNRKVSVKPIYEMIKMDKMISKKIIKIIENKHTK